MRLPDLIDQELGRLRARLDRPQLHIVETGSIRADALQYETGDGWSTLHFARQVAEHGGRLISIDLDTTVADRVLAGRRLRGHATLIRGHSIDVLADMVRHRASADVAYLDSGNDADLILHEYLIVRQLLGTPGLLMVDDVDVGSAEVVKGHRLVPWLAATGVTFRVEPRDGGSGVLVAHL